jgi:hypothetical protein
MHLISLRILAQRWPRPEKIYEDRVLPKQYMGQLLIIDREGGPCQRDCDYGPADDAKYEQVSARHLFETLLSPTVELIGRGDEQQL